MGIFKNLQLVALAGVLSLSVANVSVAAPVYDENFDELIASPYYNMDLSAPMDKNSVYDARRTLVNPVQNQGIYGTCWAFAAVASAESSIYKQMQDKGIPYNVENDPVKYSPWYLAWIKSAAPIGIDMSDERVRYGSVRNDNYFRPFADKVYTGGNSAVDPEYILALGDGFKKMPINGGKALLAPVDYSTDILHLQNVFVAEHVQEEENIAKVKAMLLMSGAAIASINADSLTQKGAVDFYTPKKKLHNHAVTLIGWDDEYDFANSKMRVKPKNKGAWIIRNSWGEDWGDKGDFYLSYEDASIDKISSLDMASNTDGFDYIDTHEDTSNIYGFRGVQPVNVELKKKGAFAATYNAANDASIQAVGFYVPEDYMSYSIKVYKHCEDFLQNTKEADYQQEGSFGDDYTPAWKGYRTVELAEPVKLTKGEKYAVEVSIFNEDGESVFETAIDTDEFAPESVVSYINEGDGKWKKVFNPEAEYKNGIFAISSVVQRIYLKNS